MQKATSSEGEHRPSPTSKILRIVKLEEDESEKSKNKKSAAMRNMIKNNHVGGDASELGSIAAVS